MKVYAFPGQGSQVRGMGRTLFERFPGHLEKASQILGYSIVEECLHDPYRRLSQTRYTQPALFVVNALSFLDTVESQGMPDFFIGHSLGEYNALMAAGAFDFETGLALVKRRAELMSTAPPGGMAAVIGVDAQAISELLHREECRAVDIANLNGPLQTVISGPSDVIERISGIFESAGATYVPLNVSGAFHSRYMSFMTEEFRLSFSGIKFGILRAPVLSNVTAAPYNGTDFIENLVSQVCSPVRWTDTIRYLLQQGPIAFSEIGPGNVLTAMMGRILADPNGTAGFPSTERPACNHRSLDNGVRAHAPKSLGSADFLSQFGLRRAYVASALDHGIASPKLVLRLAKAGLAGMLGTAGIPLSELESSIDTLRAELTKGEIYGVGLSPSPMLDAIVGLIMSKGTRLVEVSGFRQIPEALVRYRLASLSGTSGMEPLNRVFAKVESAAVAELFLAPPPQRLVDQLLARHAITPHQASRARSIMMADAVIADGSFPDGSAIAALATTIRALRDGRRDGCIHNVYIGVGGEMGEPKAIAAAFANGIDFIATNAINQCTREAATSDAVKELLRGMGPQDIQPVPTHDGFGGGETVRVLSRGVFFPARANRLRDIWERHKSWNDVPEYIRQRIEDTFFGQAFRSVSDTMHITDVKMDAKTQMASVFRWYLRSSIRWAIQGDGARRPDYQVQTSPAVGIFNAWVRESNSADLRDPCADDLALRLMDEAASATF